MSNSKWRRDFSNNRPKPSVGNHNDTLEILFKQAAGFQDIDFSVVGEDNIDFDDIDKRNRALVARKQAAVNMMNKNGSMDLDGYFSDSVGFSKVANTYGAISGNPDVSVASGVDMYSPWLSSDYYELPRSFSEERRWYRFFYDQDPIVGRAIDLKTVIPLSKMTLGLPSSKSTKTAKKVQAFFEKMWRDLKIKEKFYQILHEYNLMGEVLVYFEWDEDKNIWSKILILDPDVCEVRYLPYLDETQVFLTPDTSIQETVLEMKSQAGDRWSELADTIQELSNDALLETDTYAIPLNTDPSKGSFVKYLGRSRSPYKAGPGVSILRRLLRTLLFRDKLRQALTQITSRHMTPIRIVWAEDLGEGDVDQLRGQVDLAMSSPDFSIVANYEIHWEEVTAEGRLFDNTAIYDQTLDELLIGLGLPKEIITGEGSYGAGRINLQVLDTEFSQVRDMFTDLLSELNREVASKNNFIETDEETGLKYLIYSVLKFSRMSLRDYSDIFDFLWNLYSNGALDRDSLLDFMNIDPVEVETKLKENFMTINDIQADQMRQSLLQLIAEKIVESTDVVKKAAKGYGLKWVGEEEDDSESGVEEADLSAEDIAEGIDSESDDSEVEQKDFSDIGDYDAESAVSEEEGESSEIEQDTPAPPQQPPTVQFGIE